MDQLIVVIDLYFRFSKSVTFEISQSNCTANYEHAHFIVRMRLRDSILLQVRDVSST